MKGFEAIKQASEKIESAAVDFPNVLWFRLQDDGDNAVVRFLESGDEVYSYWYHDFSNIDEANGWRTNIPCIDQDFNNPGSCPGCENGLPRRFKGLINIIWRNAPVFKRDDDGKVVKKSNGEYEIEGHEDQIAVWRGGIELFNKVLARKDVKYKGLGSRDFEITREGRARDPRTKYSVEPNDPDAGAVALSKQDTALANDKHDLEEVAGFVDAETFQKIISKRLSESNGDSDVDIADFLSDKPFDK